MFPAIKQKRPQPEPEPEKTHTAFTKSGNQQKAGQVRF